MIITNFLHLYSFKQFKNLIFKSQIIISFFWKSEQDPFIISRFQMEIDSMLIRGTLFVLTFLCHSKKDNSSARITLSFRLNK